jgi:hypothetical protein
MLRRLSFEPLEGRQMLAVFTVTTLSDAPVTMPGQAAGTLRQAIFDATDLPGADVIQFQSGLSGDVDLSVIGDTAIGPSALLIDSEITIRGNSAGITIGRDAAASDMRLFHVVSAGSLKLESISLTGGIARGLSDAEGRGGAIYNEGTLEIVASTLYDNQAIGGDASVGIYGERGLGGAIYNDDGLFLLENATVTGSVAQSGIGSTILSSLGGGIYSRNGTVAIYNSTITNSTASTGRGVFIVAVEGTATVEVYSSIIAQADKPSFGYDFVASEDSGGHLSVTQAANLVRTEIGLGAVWDVDPSLLPLSNNGGPTFTHSLTGESLALDMGANPRSLATDQRGASYARIVGGQADIGAFELQTVVSPVLPGDYNGNEVVDAADYVLWRKTLGAEVDQFSGADGDGDGMIDTDDYGVWRENFGNDNAAAATSRANSSHTLISHSIALASFAVSRPIRPILTLSGGRVATDVSIAHAYDEALLDVVAERGKVIARPEAACDLTETNPAMRPALAAESHHGWQRMLAVENPLSIMST